MYIHVKHYCTIEEKGLNSNILRNYSMFAQTVSEIESVYVTSNQL